MRYFVYLMLLIPILVRTSPHLLMSTRPGLQVWRGVGMVFSTIFFMLSLPFLPIAQASATVFVAPLLVTALSMAFLGEKVGFRRWAATGAGLLGVLLVVRPGTTTFHPVAMLPVASALAWAFTLIFTRMISGRDRVATTMVYSAIVGFCILTALVPLVWVTPTWRDMLIGVCIGVAATTGQWIVVLAFRYADASVLAPFSYSQLVWVTILGFFFFGEVPDIWTVAGAAVIIGSGLYTAHRERLRRLRMTVLAEPPPGA